MNLYEEKITLHVKLPFLRLDMKTDLNLLLECLKYQMDCPSSQKEALITIYSICQQNSKNHFSLGNNTVIFICNVC